jgi:hypothetical protein
MLLTIGVDFIKFIGNIVVSDKLILLMDNCANN